MYCVTALTVTGLTTYSVFHKVLYMYMLYTIPHHTPVQGVVHWVLLFSTPVDVPPASLLPALTIIDICM